MNHEKENYQNDSWMKKHRLGTFFGLGLLVIYLLLEHKEHVILYSPYLFLMLCPLMHFFMHGKGGHQHGSNREKASNHCEHENREEGNQK